MILDDGGDATLAVTLGARAEEDARIMDRPGRPEDIAPVVAFLLSDMTTWIRGTNSSTSASTRVSG